MITVFTPTYNRGYVIHNLYNSLKNQTINNFEWLVVDDGSTDNTESLFAQWQKEDNNFIIRYYKKENGGKHRATNYALNIAKGNIFFPVDSDDILTTDAIQKIKLWFSEIDGLEDYCGITANKGFLDGGPANQLFNSEFLDKTFLDILTYKENNKFVLNGERAICIYTDIFRKFSYPEFENEKFVTEAVAYNRIANAGYKSRFFNDVIYLYEYKDDGLTKSGNSLFLNNPRGYGLWLKEKDIFMNKSLKNKIMTYYNFICELKDLHSDKVIAESIGISVISVKLLKCIHILLSKIKG